MLELKEFPDKNLQLRFWPKVQLRDGCWEWIGCVMGTGYGMIRYTGRPRYAHRLIYELYFGEISAGLFVLHRCDNRSCVNPDHLFLGTAADNTADMLAKGRSVKGRKIPGAGARGESHPRAKLKLTEVLEIRHRYAKGDVTQKKLAAEYGVSSPHVCGIIRGTFWKEPSHDLPALSQ